MNKDDDYEYEVLEAQENFNIKNYAHCLQLCKAILAKDSTNVHASLFAGASYQLLNKHQQAINLFQKFPTEVKEYSVFWNLYAFALLNAGFNDRAEKEFTEMVAKYPEDEDLCYSFGYFKVYIKQFAEGLIWLNKAEDLGYDGFKLYYNRGVANHYLKNKDAAIADLEKTLEIQPEYAEASAALAKIYQEREEYNTSLDYYARALYFEPENKRLRFDRLTLLINLKDENGNVTKQELAQQDADKLIPDIHEFLSITSKEGIPMKILKITVTEIGNLDFDVD